MAHTDPVHCYSAAAHWGCRVDSFAQTLALWRRRVRTRLVGSFQLSIAPVQYWSGIIFACSFSQATAKTLTQPRNDVTGMSCDRWPRFCDSAPLRFAGINPLGNPDQLGQAQDLLGIRRASSLDKRLEKFRRVGSSSK